MRLKLIFPPPASPSYIPIGISSLFAFVCREKPESELSTLDLNIETWHLLSNNEIRGREFILFMQGKKGNFYDEKQYERYLNIWNNCNERLDKLYIDAKLFVEKGIISNELESYLESTYDSILSNDPEIIGFSVMFPRQLIFSLALARFLKDGFSGTGIKKKLYPEKCKARVILGGASISIFNVEDILDACPYIDAIISGEGEPGLKSLLMGMDYRSISGLAYRTDSGSGTTIFQNPKPETISLKRLPPPDFSGLNLKSYFNPVPVLPVLFSRGCRWRRCRFCAHNFSFSGYRKKDTEQFIDELEDYIKNYGAEHFYFADQYIDILDLELLADEILKRGLEINFHFMGRPTEDYTPGRLEKLAASGCRWISWGIESGSQRLLDVSCKGTSVEVIKRILKDSHEVGINNLLMMIFGLPTSTDDDLDQTFFFIEEVREWIDAMTESNYVLYKNTPFAKDPSRFGLHITSQQELCRIGHKPLRCFKLNYMERSSDGSLRPPRGTIELELWKRRKRWLFEPTIFDKICAEHYLLYASSPQILRYNSEQIPA